MQPAEKPRLLYLITLAKAGGAQTYVASLLPAVAERYRVTVAAHGEGALADHARQAGVEFVALRHMRRQVSPFRDLAAIFELVQLFRRLRPDVVHINSSKAGVLGRIAAVIAAVPVRIFTVHGWSYLTGRDVERRVFLSLERLLCRFTTLVICVSRTHRELGLEERTCVEDRSTVIWNAVDVEAAPKAVHAGEPPVILTVGRLSPPKDFASLFQALSELPPSSFRALVVGEGPDHGRLAQALKRLGLESAVELAGHRDDVPQLLAASDIFVLPSLSESLPVSIIEAMAAGLPVVASDVGGVGELVVQGETGTLVEPGSPGALAAALRALLEDRELRRSMGLRGLARARAEFDLARFHREHLDAYETLVRSARATA